MKVICFVMKLLSCKNLTKKYASKTAVYNVSLSVNSGEIYGLVGWNGSGKSTLLKMLAGLSRPTSGVVKVDGVALARGDAPPKLGALIENPGLIPSHSGFQNVMECALAQGLPNPGEATQKVLRAVGLENDGSSSVHTYSLGMQQRLGVAIALVGSPEILLLDEPFNGLDPEGVRDVRNLISEAADKYGCAVIISSHVLDQLDRLVHRYGVIRRGTLIHELTSDEIRTSTTDIEDFFISIMNEETYSNAEALT